MTEHLNPLVKARADTGLSVVAYARRLGVHKALVQYAEEGCFRQIPPVYFKCKTSGVTLLDAYAYHLYRLHKRQKNFKASDFPKTPPQNFNELLKHLDLKPYTFACRMCVQYPEVWKLCNTHQTRLPLNVQEALSHAGVSISWIQALENNLQQTHNLGKASA